MSVTIRDHIITLLFVKTQHKLTDNVDAAHTWLSVQILTGAIQKNQTRDKRTYIVTDIHTYRGPDNRRNQPCSAALYSSSFSQRMLKMAFRKGNYSAANLSAKLALICNIMSIIANSNLSSNTTHVY